ncbi:hypothetical protein [Flavobacterium sp. B17]|nr:hypothetical protein [Flavobacterium sp. B17]
MAEILHRIKARIFYKILQITDVKSGSVSGFLTPGRNLRLPEARSR